MPNTFLGRSIHKTRTVLDLEIRFFRGRSMKFHLKYQVKVKEKHGTLESWLYLCQGGLCLAHTCNAYTIPLSSFLRRRNPHDKIETTEPPIGRRALPSQGGGVSS